MTHPRIVVRGATFAVCRRTTLRKAFLAPWDPRVAEIYFYALADAQRRTGVAVHDAPGSVFDKRQTHAMRLVDPAAQMSQAVYHHLNPVAAGLGRRRAAHAGASRGLSALEGRRGFAVKRPDVYFGPDRPEELWLELTPPPLLFDAFDGDMDALVHQIGAHHQGPDASHQAASALAYPDGRSGASAGCTPGASPERFAEPGGQRSSPSFKVGAGRVIAGQQLRIAAARETTSLPRRLPQAASTSGVPGTRTTSFSPTARTRCVIEHGVPDGRPFESDAILCAPGPLLLHDVRHACAPPAASCVGARKKGEEPASACRHRRTRCVQLGTTELADVVQRIGDRVPSCARPSRPSGRKHQRESADVSAGDWPPARRAATGSRQLSSFQSMRPRRSRPRPSVPIARPPAHAAPLSMPVEHDDPERPPRPSGHSPRSTSRPPPKDQRAAPVGTSRPRRRCIAVLAMHRCVRRFENRQNRGVSWGSGALAVGLGVARNAERRRLAPPRLRERCAPISLYLRIPPVYLRTSDGIPPDGIPPDRSDGPWTHTSGIPPDLGWTMDGWTTGDLRTSGGPWGRMDHGRTSDGPWTDGPRMDHGGYLRTSDGPRGTFRWTTDGPRGIPPDLGWTTGDLRTSDGPWRRMGLGWTMLDHAGWTATGIDQGAKGTACPRATRLNLIHMVDDESSNHRTLAIWCGAIPMSVRRRFGSPFAVTRSGARLRRLPMLRPGPARPTTRTVGRHTL